MNITQKTHKLLNVQAAEAFLRTAQSNDVYYIFAAKHTPFNSETGGTDENPPTPGDSIKSSVNIFNEMVFGKRIESDDISMMIRRIDWQSNTVYDMYVDDDPDLASKDFFVVVEENTEYNVYKCLFNNNGGVSTQKPFGKDLTPVEFPQDGYIWKYMFTANQFNFRKFATDNYIPVSSNPQVTSAAINGSIDIIRVNNPGAGYNNYTVGVFPDASAIAVGTDLRFGLDVNAVGINTFYKNCLIRIASGPAANEYRLITDFEVINGQKVITIDSPFNNRPGVGDQYEIYPNVFITDIGGTSNITCKARALINSQSGNSISRIEVLNPGSGYRSAQADLRVANIVSVAVYSDLSPIISPPGGHGSQIDNELFAHTVGVSTSFIGNNEPFISANDFRTIGLLKNPLFANVEVQIDIGTLQGNFIPGETIYRYKPIKLFGEVQTYSNTYISGTNTMFIDSLRINDRVLITNGVNNLFANVLNVIDNNTIELSRAANFTSSNCSIMLTEATPFGVLSSLNSEKLILSHVIPTGLEVSSWLVGHTTSGVIKVSNTQPYITANGRDISEFDGFTQLIECVGTFSTTNTFEEDEIVVQTDGVVTNSTPSATVHSSINNQGSANDFLYLTNIRNSFDLTNNIPLRGLTSNAFFNVLYKYDSNIIPDSGDILYTENLSPVKRHPQQTETIKIFLNF